MSSEFSPDNNEKQNRSEHGNEWVSLTSNLGKLTVAKSNSPAPAVINIEKSGGPAITAFRHERLDNGQTQTILPKMINTKMSSVILSDKPKDAR